MHFFRYDEFKSDEDKVVIGAGENGAPVHLYGQEKITAEKLMATEAFNIIASDKISMHRTVPGMIAIFITFSNIIQIRYAQDM